MENIINITEILVADDEPAVALAITSALRFCGFASTAVSNGEAALEAVQAEPGRFALILSDHNMPGTGGLTLVKGLRAIGYPGKIVILSGYLSDDVEARYRELEVDQLLSKPFNVHRLREALNQALNSTACAS
ncbi:MAG: response regulator [Chthoniobacteraceae bacterium]